MAVQKTLICCAILNAVTTTASVTTLRLINSILLTIILTLCTASDVIAQTQDNLEVAITVESDIYFQALEISKDRSLLEITDFSGTNMSRDLVDFIMVQKALILGGLELNIQFQHGNYDGYNPKALANGKLLLSLDSIWLSEANKHKNKLYISNPVIVKGEYFAGIFTSPKNTSALSIHSLADFKRHSVISSRDWSTDWLTLSAIKPRQLIHNDDWINMAKKVHRQQADVMLAPFANKPPFRYRGLNYELMAVDGVKIKLDDSRHYCVSRAHPLGERTFKALEKGLKKLQQQGAIRQAYRQVGFLNPHVKNWIVLNP